MTASECPEGGSEGISEKTQGIPRRSGVDSGDDSQGIPGRYCWGVASLFGDADVPSLSAAVESPGTESHDSDAGSPPTNGDVRETGERRRCDPGRGPAACSATDIAKGAAATCAGCAGRSSAQSARLRPVRRHARIPTRGASMYISPTMRRHVRIPTSRGGEGVGHRLRRGSGASTSANTSANISGRATMTQSRAGRDAPDHHCEVCPTWRTPAAGDHAPLVRRYRRNYRWCDGDPSGAPHQSGTARTGCRGCRLWEWCTLACPSIPDLYRSSQLGCRPS
eukprot:gene1404-biopygen7324